MATLGALLLLPAKPPLKSAMPRVTADAMAVSGERGRVMAAVTVADRTCLTSLLRTPERLIDTSARTPPAGR
jgi:hypothetical protein